MAIHSPSTSLPRSRCCTRSPNLSPGASSEHARTSSYFSKRRSSLGSTISTNKIDKPLSNVEDRNIFEIHSNVNLATIENTTDYDRSYVLRIPVKESIEKRIDCREAGDLKMGRLHSARLHNGDRGVSEDVTGVYGGVESGSEFKSRSGVSVCVRVRWVAACVVVSALLATCAASPARARETRAAHDSKSVINYLTRFGYLRKSQLLIGNLRKGDEDSAPDNELRPAIEAMQAFAGIPVTGEIDEATTELLSMRRCGMPDREEDDDKRRKKRFLVQGQQWKHTNLTWSLSSQRLPSQLDPHHTRQVLSRAFRVWAQHSRLTFTEINSDQADIVVSFARRFHDDAYPFDGRGQILAHAFFPGNGNGGDAHFDDDELWLLQPRDDEEEGTSLFAVAAHEFGHSLGLAHSEVKGALMYPYYQGIQPNFNLPEDDRRGIQQMYGVEGRRIWSKNPYHRPAPTTTTSTTTTTTTTTTTHRPYVHHTDHHSDWWPKRDHPSRHPSYSDNPRYPQTNPQYPEQRPYYPDRNPEHPKRPHHNRPRPRPDTTTTTSTTTRVPYRRYNPKTYATKPPYKKPYYPEKTTPRTTQRPAYTTPRPAPRPTPRSDKPDTCDTNYDAVSLIRNEVFIFKNKYHWRIGTDGLYRDYPIETSRMWSGLPSHLTHVDAVYERPDKKIAFFIGKEYYLFDTQALIPGYPRPLTDLGLPASLERVDAAMVWGHNSKTFFYSGAYYWKFDEQLGKVELDYPRDMSMWNGIGYNIDSAFQWKDGKTYFFKGKGFWKFNDVLMSVEHEQQQASGPFWMGCPNERSGRRAHYHAPALDAPGSTLRSPSSAHTHAPHSLLTVLASLLMLCITRSL